MSKKVCKECGDEMEVFEICPCERDTESEADGVPQFNVTKLEKLEGWGK